MGRSFQVRVEGSLSDKRLTHAGVPQGSVLSPILYNLYTADFPKNPQTKLALFADDALVYASSPYVSEARNKIQTHLQTLLPWFTKWKLSLNESKCESTVLTRKRVNTIIHTPIRINNHDVPINPHLKYLGVTLDRSLHFLQHIKNVVSSGNNAARNLHSLISSRSPLSVENKLVIYNQIIKPVLLYAAPVWNNISDTTTNILQVFQNRMLRHILNANRYTRIHDLHTQTDTQLIRDQLNELAYKFFTDNILKSNLTRTLTDIRYYHYTVHKPIYFRTPIYFQLPPQINP